MIARLRFKSGPALLHRTMFNISLLRSAKCITLENSCVLTNICRSLRTSSYDKDKEDKTSKISENIISEGQADDKSKSSNQVNAKMKLNELLVEMMKDGPLTKQPAETVLNLAKAKRTKKEKPVKDKSGAVIDKKVIQATKEVAKSLGGDVKETESELLEKLLSTKGSSNLNEVIGGMVIERDAKREPPKEWSEIRREQGQVWRSARQASEGKRQPRFSRGPLPSVDLFGGTPLGIFTGEKQASPKHENLESVSKSIWEKLEKRELHLSTSHPPRNYFQQMILWTEQGKLWKFPIDNEQGLEEENEVFFTEHVFLEKHLEPLFPKKGPVRHFMELVCVGLSKNPYLTVKEKKAHIQWYADYFAAKKDILKEVGALPEETNTLPQTSV